MPRKPGERPLSQSVVLTPPAPPIVASSPRLGRHVPIVPPSPPVGVRSVEVRTPVQFPPPLSAAGPTIVANGPDELPVQPAVLPLRDAITLPEGCIAPMTTEETLPVAAAASTGVVSKEVASTSPLRGLVCVIEGETNPQPRRPLGDATMIEPEHLLGRQRRPPPRRSAAPANDPPPPPTMGEWLDSGDETPLEGEHVPPPPVVQAAAPSTPQVLAANPRARALQPSPRFRSRPRTNSWPKHHLNIVFIGLLLLFVIGFVLLMLNALVVR